MRAFGPNRRGTLAWYRAPVGATLPAGVRSLPASTRFARLWSERTHHQWIAEPSRDGGYQYRRVQ